MLEKNLFGDCYTISAKDKPILSDVLLSPWQLRYEPDISLILGDLVSVRYMVRVTLLSLLVYVSNDIDLE